MDNSKKIVFFINHVAFFMSHRLPIAERLISEGYNITLITGKGGSDEMEKIATKKLRDYRINHIRLVFKPSSMNLILEIYSILQLIFYLIKLNPILLHCVSPKAVLYGSIAITFSRTRSLVVAISGMGHLFAGSKKNSSKSKILQRSYLFILKIAFLINRNSTVIVQNNDDFNSIINSKISTEDKISLIKGSGVNLDDYKDIVIENKEKVVLFVGRMLKEKGVNEFILAANKIKLSNPEWRFVLIGAADYENPSSISAESLIKIQENRTIEWLGHINDISDYMKKASIVCLPSYREGMPKVLLEAAAAGCATVTTDVPGCREAIINNHTGLLVPLADQDNLNIALLTLIEDSNLRERFGKSGIRHATLNYGIESVVDKHLEIYNNLI